MIREMAASLRAHPEARRIIDNATDIEVSAVWDDSETAARCKLREDILCEKIGVLCNVKTSINASPGAFERSIFTFGYHRQAALYIDGLAKNGIQIEHFAFIVMEKKPPCCVAVYRLRDDVIRAGYEQNRKLLATYAECKRTGRWPGYGDTAMEIAVPKWAWSQMGLTEGVTI